MERGNLEEKLKNMPKIKGDQSKDILFTKIQAELISDKKPKRHLPLLIPSFVALVASVIIFIFVQSSETNPFQIADQYESSGNEEMTSFSEDQESATVEEESIADSAEREADLNGTEESTIMENTVTNIESMVFYQQFEQQELVTIAVADQNNQYAIPITLVDPSSTGDPDDYYNRIASFVEEEELGVNAFPFEDISFEFTDNNQQLYMTFPNDYQFPDGGSNASMFQQILNLMFSSYGLGEIIVQTQAGGQVDLGPIGNKETLAIQEVERQVYKVYQVEDKQRLLVPTSNNKVNDIHDALTNMQIKEEDFNIKASIPADTSFEIMETESDQLTIAFTHSDQFGDNQTTANMIEAVLMTAKSFDYQTVKFFMPIDNKMVRDYPIQDSIPVPDGVNPKILH